MTDSTSMTIDNLTNRKPKNEPKLEPVIIKLDEDKEPITPNQDVHMNDMESRTKRDSMSDEILDVMLNDDNIEKMTDLNSKGAMTFARADTMAEIFKSKSLTMFSLKAKQLLVSNKRLGRTEVSDVLNNVGDTVDDSTSIKEKMFGDTF